MSDLTSIQKVPKITAHASDAIALEIENKVKAFRESCLVSDIAFAESALELGKLFGVKLVLYMEYGEKS